MRRSRASIVGALCFAITATARAETADEPIDLLYRAFEGCPSEKQFLSLVVGRAAKTLIATERARGRRFVVTLGARRRETIGRLEIVSGGAVASREVTGANCAEVASALALFTALAIDPSAAVEPPATAPQAPTDEPPAASRPTPPPTPPTAETKAPALLVTAPVREEARREAPGLARAELLAGALGTAAGGFDGGSARPAIAPGAGVSIEWVTPGFGAYRLSGAYFAKAETNAATFTWVSGRWDACPLVFRPARDIAFEPCVAVEIGRVEAAAKAAPDLAPSTQRRWWVAGDLIGRFRYAPPNGRFFAEIEGGLVAPFTRYVFFLGSENDVRGELHRVPSAAWMLGLGLGARIL